MITTNRLLATLILTSMLLCALPLLSIAQPFGKTSTRIVGGVEVDPKGKYSWQVALVKHELANLYDAQFCGGTLISPRWVLTAAHCTARKTADQIDVVVGIHNLSTGEGYQRKTAVRIINHENYDAATTDNDIALIELETPVTLGGSGETSVNVIPLISSAFADITGMNVVVSGWGNISSTKIVYPSQLMEVTVPVISNSICNDSSHYNGQITNNMFCAGFDTGGKDACQGDSGGPVVINNGSGFVLSGIVSWGEGCAAPNYPGVYTRVANYLSWIAVNTSATPIPKTGQTLCYNSTGTAIACADTGQDGDKQAGTAQTDPLFTDNGTTITDKVYGMTWHKDAGTNGASIKTGVIATAIRFTDNSNGTITDNLTGVVWLKNANCAAVAGGVTKTTSLTWANALTWSNNLKNSDCSLSDGSVAGDWRLPNINELASLPTNYIGTPADWLLEQGFGDVQYSSYWSSSSYATSKSFAWDVRMDSGGLGSGYKTGSSYVWPVRGGRYGSLGTLTITKAGTGTGSVSSNLAAINCGASCSANFAKGQSLVLTATADGGSRFTSWTGCDSTDVDNRCTVAVNGAKSVTATFMLPTLTVKLSGSGSGTVTSTTGITPQLSCATPQTSCSASVSFGTDVALSATETLGSASVVWSDACSGVPCTFKMDADKSANATFTMFQYLKNAGTYYGTVKDAFAAARSGETVKAKAMQMLDSGVIFDTGQPILFQGGYTDTGFINQSGYTTISGSLKIKAGTLRIDRLKIIN